MDLYATAGSCPFADAGWVDGNSDPQTPAANDNCDSNSQTGINLFAATLPSGLTFSGGGFVNIAYAQSGTTDFASCGWNAVSGGTGPSGTPASGTTCNANANTGINLFGTDLTGITLDPAEPDAAWVHIAYAHAGTCAWASAGWTSKSGGGGTAGSPTAGDTCVAGAYNTINCDGVPVVNMTLDPDMPTGLGTVWTTSSTRAWAQGDGAWSAIAWAAGSNGSGVFLTSGATAAPMGLIPNINTHAVTVDTSNGDPATFATVEGSGTLNILAAVLTGSSTFYCAVTGGTGMSMACVVTIGSQGSLSGACLSGVTVTVESGGFVTYDPLNAGTITIASGGTLIIETGSNPDFSGTATCTGYTLSSGANLQVQIGETVTDLVATLGSITVGWSNSTGVVQFTDCAITASDMLCAMPNQGVLLYGGTYAVDSVEPAGDLFSVQLSYAAVATVVDIAGEVNVIVDAGSDLTISGTAAINSLTIAATTITIESSAVVTVDAAYLDAGVSWTIEPGAELTLNGIPMGGSSAAVWPAEANVSTTETAWGPTGAEYAGQLDLGLYTLTSGIVWPAEANVSTVETAWGPTGAEYAGDLDLDLYVLIAGLPSADDVRATVDRGDGTLGNVIVPAAGNIVSGVHAGWYHVGPPEAWEVTGTYQGGGGGTYTDPGEAHVQAGTQYVFNDAQKTGTYNPMAAAVWPAKAHVSTEETAWGPTGAEYAGELDLSLYVLIAALPSADDVRATVDRGDGTHGNLIVPAAADLRDGVFAGWHHVGEPDTYEVTGTAELLELSPDVEQATGVLVCYDAAGELAADVEIVLRQLTPPPDDDTGHGYDESARTVLSDGNGVVQATGLWRGATYQVQRGVGQATEFIVPQAENEGEPEPTFELPTILGSDQYQFGTGIETV